MTDLNTSILSNQSGASQDDKNQMNESTNSSTSTSPQFQQRINADKKIELKKLIHTLVLVQQARRKDSQKQIEYLATNSISRKNSEQLFDYNYDKLEKIGEGGNSCVYRCRKINDDSQHYAVKITKTIDEEIILNETDASNRLLKLNHTNICKAYDFIVEKSLNTTYLIMEFICGKNLDQWIASKRTFQENEVRFIMNGLLEGIDYLQTEGFVHRDITTSNVIYDDETKKVKIIDLSTCKSYKHQPHCKLLTEIGNDIFRAPEMFEGIYSKEIDMWGAGLVFYILLFSKHPFFEEGDDSVDLIRKVTSTEIDWDKLYEIHSGRITTSQIDLCKKMLQKQPHERILARQALAHPFLKQRLCSKDFSFEMRKKSHSMKSIMRMKSCEKLSKNLSSQTDIAFYAVSAKTISAEEETLPHRYF